MKRILLALFLITLLFFAGCIQPLKKPDVKTEEKKVEPKEVKNETVLNVSSKENTTVVSTISQLTEEQKDLFTNPLGNSLNDLSALEGS